MTDVIGIDHIYIAVTDLDRSAAFYDRVFGVLGFRSNRFTLPGANGGTPHIQYYNRHFGYVLRPAPAGAAPAGVAGLHHFCFRVETVADVEAAVSALNAAGIAATPATRFPEYAPDYVATFFSDPDGLRLEITNYRAERRERHDHWDQL